MAHLWLRNSEGWSVATLVGQRTCLILDDAGVLSLMPEAPPSKPVVVIQPLNSADPQWVALAPPSTRFRVNGQAVLTGIRILQDRDELQLMGRASAFFATERLARVESFPGRSQPVCCPRCKQVIHAGDDAVRCPSCRMWHHQREQQPCWTYTPSCAFCDQSTSLSEGYRWTPEAL